MEFPGRVLGLDLGARRIGLAVSDPEARLAFPAGCLRSEGPERDLAALRQLVAAREIKRIVVGLPIHMDGRAGPEAEAARRFATEIAHATGVPVEMQDERWTTVEAERALRTASGRGSGQRGSRRSRRRRDSRGDVDAAAATILLRTYLERTRAQSP
jgi:putative Holliday junction resolvase